MKRDIKKSIKDIAIVAGGTLDLTMKLRIKKASYIIGVDRGAYWLLKNNNVPDVAIGDFDSVSPRQFAFIETKVARVVRHPKEKDTTDLELAIDFACTVKPKTIELFGVIGSRMDHTWAGVQLLQLIKSHNISGSIVDMYNELSLLSGFVTLHKSQSYRYISFFPLHDRSQVTLTGFRYNVSRRVFVSGSSLGVSNQIVSSPAKVIIHDGQLLMVRSRD